MLEKISRAIASFALGVLIFSTSSAQAGDIIDFLPEVLQAQSKAARAQSIIAVGAASTLTICQQDLDFSQIPDHYLFDQNGKLHSHAEISQITAELFCLFLNLGFADIDILKLLNGEVVEIVDVPTGYSPFMQLRAGDMIDGRKQSVRFMASQLVPLDLLYKLRNYSFHLLFKIDIDPDDICVSIKEWVLEGAMFELKNAAFLALRFDQILDETLDVSPDICSVRVDHTVEELTQKAKEGDIDAVVSLSIIWTEGLPPISPGIDGDTLEQIQNDIELFELLILENTEKHPLLTMAAIEPLASLYLLESLLLQEE